MSSDPAVEVRGLSKLYVLGERQGGFPTLRDEIARLPRRVLGGHRKPARTRDRIWALRDVTFDVERGQAVGIIGHNGAGKTTLLKILSQITPPTGGEIRITGKVGSLLEVGTGFHPELSGRDNVYLNGAILGMRKRDIRRRFDEIVAFAEVERFIDTPVKRYSSGMHVRLAFAVAAHLEPDILIVDEVLAVGDEAFQRKCLGKMDEVRGHGRTVLFVSHNMPMIRALTADAIWLDHGRIVEYGPTGEVVGAYLATVRPKEAGGIADLRAEHLRRSVRKWTAQNVRFETVAMLGLDGEPTSQVVERTPLRVAVTFRVVEPVRFLELFVRVKDPSGDRLFSSYSGQQAAVVEPGLYSVVCEFPDNPLLPGHFQLELLARGIENQDIVPAALVFQIVPGEPDDQDLRLGWRASGIIRVRSAWTELEPMPAASSGAEAAAT